MTEKKDVSIGCVEAIIAITSKMDTGKIIVSANLYDVLEEEGFVSSMNLGVGGVNMDEVDIDHLSTNPGIAIEKGITDENEFDINNTSKLPDTYPWPNINKALNNGAKTVVISNRLKHQALAYFWSEYKAGKIRFEKMENDYYAEY